MVSKMNNAYLIGDEEIGIVLRAGVQPFLMFVDQEDFDEVSKSSWALSGLYGTTWRNKAKVFCHRLITNAQSGLVVDHINGNTLDNRRRNLRVVSHKQNTRNRTILNVNNKSGYPGVFFDKDRGKWRSYIFWDKKNTYCGISSSPAEAFELRLQFMSKLDPTLSEIERARYAG